MHSYMWGTRFETQSVNYLVPAIVVESYQCMSGVAREYTQAIFWKHIAADWLILANQICRWLQSGFDDITACVEHCEEYEHKETTSKRETHAASNAPFFHREKKQI